MLTVSARFLSDRDIVAINAVIDCPCKLSASILVSFDSLSGIKFYLLYKAVIHLPSVKRDLFILLASC